MDEAVAAGRLYLVRRGLMTMAERQRLWRVCVCEDVAKMVVK